MDNEFYTLPDRQGMAKIASALADKKEAPTTSAKDGDLATAADVAMNRPPASSNLRESGANRAALTVAPNNPQLADCRTGCCRRTRWRLVCA